MSFDPSEFVSSDELGNDYDEWLDEFQSPDNADLVAFDDDLTATFDDDLDDIPY